MVTFITPTVRQERLLEGASFIGFRNFLFFLCFSQVIIENSHIEMKHIVLEVCMP